MRKLGFSWFRTSESKLKHAQNLLENGKVGQGMKELHTLATAGNSEAQFMLGELYLADQKVPMNGHEALRWFRQSAENHNPGACHRLAVLNYMGISAPSKGDDAKVFDVALQQGEPDYAGALSWAERAIDGGNADGMALAAHILTQGPDTFRDAAKGLELYRRAAERGSVQGLYGYGVALFGAAKTPKERDEALSLIQQAARRGSPDAELTLGTILEYEGGKDAQAFDHFMNAAPQHPAAQMKVGVAYYQARGVERDVSKAETWLRKAAQGGEVEAIALVGDINLQGDGAVPNFPEAHSWYRRAVEAGHVGAAVTLAQLVYNGMGCKANHAEAKRLLDFAADRGNDQARKLLGLLKAGQA